MPTISQFKVVVALPSTLEADAIYWVRSGSGFDIYVTNGSGTIVAYPANYARQGSTLPDLDSDNIAAGVAGADGSSGWTTVGGTLDMQGSSVLRFTKTAAAGSAGYAERPIVMPAGTSDFILDIQVRMSVGINSGAAIWLANEGLSNLYGLFLNYDRSATVARQGALSFTAYQAGVVSSVNVLDDLDTLRPVRLLLHMDTANSRLDCYVPDAVGNWILRGRLSGVARNAVNTLRVTPIGAAPAGTWVDIQHVYVTRPTVVLMGDSISASSWQQYCRLYPERLNNLVISRGVGGENSGQTLARVSEVIATGCRVVILHASSNDYGVVDTATRTANIQSTISALHAAGIRVILLNALYGTATHAAQPGRAQFLRTWWETYSASVGADARVDINQPLIDGGYCAEWLSPDALHLTELGYRVLARYVAAHQRERENNALADSVQAARDGLGLAKSTFLAYPFGEGNGVAFNDPNVGEVISLPYLNPAALGVLTVLCHPQAALTVSGAGAGLETYGSPMSQRLTSGSTATGWALLELVSLADNQIWPANTSDGWVAFARVGVQNLSSSTNRYTATVTLFTAGNGGIYCSYSDSVNSGRWQLSYKDSAGTTVTVDTGVSPAAGGVVMLRASCLREASGLYRLQVSVDGVTVLNTTDCHYNTVRSTGIAVGNSFRITKSIGTTACQMYVRSSGLRVRRS